MTGERPFDLFVFVETLVASEPWIEESQLFCFRRYTTNVSYGSDINLLVVPYRAVSIQDLRADRVLKVEHWDRVKKRPKK
jgi:hypothetical protein